MNRTILLFLLCLSSVFGDAITYERQGGRLGDNLINYLHAKWISLKEDKPLLYVAFPYSNQLVLSEKEQPFKKKKVSPSFHLTRMILAKFNERSFLTKIPFLKFCYISPYFPEDPWEVKRWGAIPYRVDWKNETFRKVAKEMIAPKEALDLVHPPIDKISIALHFREGGTFDQMKDRQVFPLKFPPFSFYVEGLKATLALFPNQPVYCYLFTDAEDPSSIASALKEALPKDAPIVFDFRKEGNHHNTNVLEDFFSLFNFDVLIRPQSNFSILPSRIHDYALVYSPLDGFASEEGNIVTEVDMVLNTALCEKIRP